MTGETLRMADSTPIALKCTAPDCNYYTAAMPSQFSLCQLSMHHKMVHGVDSVGGLHPMDIGMWFDGNKVVWNTSTSSSA